MISDRLNAIRPKYILEAAARLYPYLAVQYPEPQETTAVAYGSTITEGDKARAVRAVELAFVMVTVIREKIVAREQEPEQEHGA